MNKRRLKRRGKLFIYILFIIFCLLLFFYMVDCFFSPIHPNYEYEFKEVIISQGERLWDIAKKELEINEYYKDEDIRQIIYEIEKDNNITSTIYAGQVIKIRIKKDELNSTNQSLDNSSIYD